MKKDTLLNGQSAIQCTGSGPTSEDRLPHPRPFEFVEESVRPAWHIHILRNCIEGTLVDLSTMMFPSSLNQVFSQGKGFGAGPASFCPSLLNRLPWHGQAMTPNSGFHAFRHPR